MSQRRNNTLFHVEPCSLGNFTGYSTFPNILAMSSFNSINLFVLVFST